MKPLARLALLLTIGLSLGGCSDQPREPVQITLCKQLLINHTGLSNPPEWSAPKVDMQRYQGVDIKVSYAATEQYGAGKASCHYAYEVEEEDARQDADPMLAFGSVPESLVLNGLAVEPTAIDRLVEKAMIAQGKAFAERVRKSTAQ